jgi:lipopolysaccharide export system protein LptA
MASSFRSRFAWSLLVCLLSATQSGWAQEVPEIDLGAQKSLPIALDADASEFDRKNDKLIFTGLRITQGTLHIEADDAEANRLDFEDSQWVFIGNVLIENIGTKAWSDYAEIHFRNHEIKNAMLRGKPARFRQVSPEDKQITEGHAAVMDYDLRSGLIRMSDDAWLSDGSNEVSGNKITYDLVREYIIADADESGQVRMKINPPDPDAAEKEAEQSP